MKYLFRSIIFSLIFLLFTTYAFAKNKDLVYSKKNISNYFSGIISINQNNTSQAFDFFKKINNLKGYHPNFDANYLFALVLLEKYDESFAYARDLNLENKDIPEANLLLGINSYINNDYFDAEKYFTRLKNISYNYYNFENFLIALAKAAAKDKPGSLKYLRTIPDNLNNLTKIQEAMIHCSFDTPMTIPLFKNLINNQDHSFSRYNFFLVDYLLYKNDINSVKNIINNNKKDFETNILLRQTKKFIFKEKYQTIKNLFNCQNPKDLMAEFLYIIANLYSTEENYNLSNFYLKISLLLNKNFSSNKILLADNYLNQKNYEESKKIYKSIKKKGSIYSWYASKKIASTIFVNETRDKAINYLEREIKKIPDPDHYNYYDLANFLKANKEYKEAIKYYSMSLTKIELDHYLISDILENRGACYERLGMWKEGEQDLKESLRLSPDQPYVLNYLAYSWLEKKINIDEALVMLKKANEIKKNDAYIIDSLGWGFYLNANYLKAEKLLRRANELMPFDPIVSDHYGDILWKLNKNLQARYFWKQALNLEKKDKEFMDTVGQKLIFGLLDES